MGKVRTSEVVDKVFGKCIKLENDIVELLVTIDFGPRVIHFARTGMENMFYQDVQKTGLGEKFDVYDGDQLVLYGGHRIWISPEDLPRCYHPDNKPVTYEKIENGMTFTATVEALNNIKKILTVSLVEDGPIVKVSNSIMNCGSWDIEFAPWCITMMDKGGVEVMPMPDRETGCLANRNVSLWDYSNMADERVYWGNKYITLSQKPGMTQPFKLGYNNEAGWAAYFNKGQVFIKFFEPSVDGFYPDNGCCFETYTNGVMLEIESLGEFVALEPGGVVTQEEEWELYAADKTPSNNEEEIRDIMANYL